MRTKVIFLAKEEDKDNIMVRNKKNIKEGEEQKSVQVNSSRVGTRILGVYIVYISKYI